MKRLSLGNYPTPVFPLKKLSMLLKGPEIYIKRDDLTGLAFGGNKVRKLEYILADATEQGADTLVTAGAMQSNHCRQTAAAATILGLDCHLLLGGTKPLIVQGNVLLDQLLGAKIHWTGESRKGELIPQLVEELRSNNKNPYVVPYGGSNILGAMGFVNAFNELCQQTDIDTFSHIIFASSSGGTHAGLVVGNKLSNKNIKFVGIQIDKESEVEESFTQVILNLANKTLNELNDSQSISSGEIILNRDFLGAGYGVLNASEREAITMVAQQEGVLLDPVYTARAMAALIGMVRNGELTKNNRVLFWHTGGTPALFAYSDQLYN